MELQTWFRVKLPTRRNTNLFEQEAFHFRSLFLPYITPLYVLFKPYPPLGENAKVTIWSSQNIDDNKNSCLSDYQFVPVTLQAKFHLTFITHLEGKHYNFICFSAWYLNLRKII